MSAASSNTARWSTLLEPVAAPGQWQSRPDDPRLGEVVVFWSGEPYVPLPGQAVLLGFPQDEGVRRNHGRCGAAEAPGQIRTFLYRLTAADPRSGCSLRQVRPIDMGNVRITGGLEQSQDALAEVVADLLTCGAVPIVLGGGHETAYGHYLGYVRAGLPVGIVNIDAHLDVRPLIDGQGHSGSPFRQAMEHPEQPLPGSRYVCLGAQPHAVSLAHSDYVQQRGGVIGWRDEVRGSLGSFFSRESERFQVAGCRLYLSLDADVIQVSEMPGVSAPNSLGLAGAEVLSLVEQAGRSSGVSSFDLVEINPRFDRDSQSSRWAALAICHFLRGLCFRG
jgi:formiminoglutamase